MRDERVADLVASGVKSYLKYGKCHIFLTPRGNAVNARLSFERLNYIVMAYIVMARLFFERLNYLVMAYIVMARLSFERRFGACRRQTPEGPAGRSEGGLTTRHN